jgi:hypothetical protein
MYFTVAKNIIYLFFVSLDRNQPSIFLTNEKKCNFFLFLNKSLNTKLKKERKIKGQKNKIKQLARVLAQPPH